MHGRANDVLRIYVESKGERPGCTNCGVLAQLKDRAAVELVDLACLGRATRLIWHKCRWKCAEALCPVGSWTEEDTRIAAPRIVLSDRAARWVTLQVGYYARSVNDLALELGCDWHTVSDAVIAMAPHWWTMTPSGSGIVGALGPTKSSSPGTAPFTAKSSPPRSSTSPGASSSTSFLVAVVHTPTAWLEKQGEQWRKKVALRHLGSVEPLRKVFTTMVPDAVQVADPFHLVKLANTKLDECRRRVQNETLGHRGRKSDPLYRCRRLFDQSRRAPRRGRPREADGAATAPAIPTATWPPCGKPKKPSESCTRTAIRSALQWVEQLGADLQDADYPSRPEHSVAP